MNLKTAREFFEKNAPEGSNVGNVIFYKGEFMAIITLSDPDEGGFLPFFKIKGKQVVDFSPQDYSNPLEIITLLTEEK